MSNFDLNKQSDSPAAGDESTSTSPAQAFTPRAPDRITAGILAILLGGVGVHKFYTGAWGWGLLYLLFCWTYIPTVLATVEGIRYLVIKNEPFEASYRKTKGAFGFIW